MSWCALLTCKASIYVLDQKSKQWITRGISGAFNLYKNTQNTNDIRIKWSKNENITWWKLVFNNNNQLKPKGNRVT